MLGLVLDLVQQVFQLLYFQNSRFLSVFRDESNLHVFRLLPQVRREFEGDDSALAVPDNDDGEGGVEGDVVQFVFPPADDLLNTDWVVSVKVHVVHMDLPVIAHSSKGCAETDLSEIDIS